MEGSPSSEPETVASSRTTLDTDDTTRSSTTKEADDSCVKEELAGGDQKENEQPESAAVGGGSDTEDETDDDGVDQAPTATETNNNIADSTSNGAEKEIVDAQDTNGTLNEEKVISPELEQDLTTENGQVENESTHVPETKNDDVASVEADDSELNGVVDDKEDPASEDNGVNRSEPSEPTTVNVDEERSTAISEEKKNEKEEEEEVEQQQSQSASHIAESKQEQTESESKQQGNEEEEEEEEVEESMANSTLITETVNDFDISNVRTRARTASVAVDRWGYIIRDKPKAPETKAEKKLRRKQLETDRRREEKWLAMIQEGPSRVPLCCFCFILSRFLSLSSCMYLTLCLFLCFLAFFFSLAPSLLLCRSLLLLSLCFLSLSFDRPTQGEGTQVFQAQVSRTERHPRQSTRFRVACVLWCRCGCRAVEGQEPWSGCVGYVPSGSLTV